MGKQYSRRRFIKITSVSAASLVPVAHLLGKEMEVSDDEIESVLDDRFNQALNFHLLGNNLLNLHFYFLNIEKHGNSLRPRIKCKKSFLIVRLPQQHVTESGFWDNYPEQDKSYARLSGYSYLAFELWPGRIDSKRCLPFNITTLMDWNCVAHFRLITLVDWLCLQNESIEFVTRDQIKDKKCWNQKDFVKHDANRVCAGEILLKYVSIITKLLPSKDPLADFVPVTLFEVPEGLFISPITRPPSPGATFSCGFFKNQTCEDSVPLLEWTCNGVRHVQKQYEVWNNSFKYTWNKVSQKGPTKEKNVIVVEKPYFRAIGFKSETPLDLNVSDQVSCEKQWDQDKGDLGNARNLLPSLLDKEELAYLTQYANSPKNPAPQDTTAADFDIKEIDGLFYTGLGIITHLKYYNVGKMLPGTDVIEYEHIINEGRDITIRVSRLGINCKTGHWYKHVIEGVREISNDDSGPASFIRLRQYCECVEKDIDYSDKFTDPGVLAYKPIQVYGTVEKPASDNKCNRQRYPFISAHVVEKERIPILCLQDTVILNEDVATLECKMWFWPVKASAGNPAGTLKKDIKIDDYLKCKYTALDHDNKPCDVETPFIFIRASYLANGDLDAIYNNYFSAPVGLRQSPLVGQKVAFKESATFIPAGNGTQPTSSKVNILETDYLDTYFNVRVLDANQANNIHEVAFVLFPQLLQARVYIDHIKDLTQRKLPSYIEYHQTFIDFGVEDKVNNYGRQLFKHTDAFITPGGLPIEYSNYPQERSGILNALQESKDKLGNVVTPDIPPDTISESYGITLPVNANFVDVPAASSRSGSNFKLLSPRDVLAGKFSEILGGLDLREILNEFIPEINTPVFDIYQKLDQISDAVVNSDIYKQIVNFTVDDPFPPHGKITPADLVKKCQDQIAETKKKIANAENQINTLKQQLAQWVPNAEDLKQLARLLCEKIKSDAINFSIIEDWDNKGQSIEPSIEAFAKAIAEYTSDQVKVLQCGQVTEAKLSFNLKRDELAQLQKNWSDAFSKLAQWPDFSTYFSVADIALAKGLLDNYANNVFDEIVLSAKELDKRRTDACAFLGTFVQESHTLSVNGSAINIDPRSFMISDVLTPSNSPVPLQILVKTGGLDDLASTGLLHLQTRIEHLQRVITTNQSMGDFKNEVVLQVAAVCKNYKDAYANKVKQLQKNIQSPLDDFAKSFSYISQKLDSIPAAIPIAQFAGIAKEIASKANKYTDFVRQLDPYYYFYERSRVLKDSRDIVSKFSKPFLKEYNSEINEINNIFSSYTDSFNTYVKSAETFLTDYAAGQKDKNGLVKALNDAKAVYADIIKSTPESFDTKVKSIVGKVLSQWPDVADLLQKVDTQIDFLATQAANISEYQSYVNKYIQDGVGTLETSIQERVQSFINDRITALQQAVSPADIARIQGAIAEAQNLYQMLTSISQKDLTYNWKTDDFRDVSLGAVSFKTCASPKTSLNVDVRSTIHFATGKFPPTISRIENYSENSFANFGVSFFNAITVNFDAVKFIASTGSPAKFDVKIRGVQFDGALSFVQSFEKYLQSKGLILSIQSDHLELGYSLPLPAISAPAMSFFNLSINLSLIIYFDKRPMRFGFSISRPESKFVISAGIYAGFGYFGIVCEPKKGVVTLDIALEAGAYAGLSMGLITGFVKLAFGFRYTKDESNVRLEGYVVAEGQLSVWILQISARIYLGVTSVNSYVEGQCTVTYSAKLGFIQHTFSGTFKKHIAGANSNQTQQQESVEAYLNSVATLCAYDYHREASSDDDSYTDSDAIDLEPVSYKEWREFIETY